MEQFTFTHPDNGRVGNIEYDNIVTKFWYTLDDDNVRCFERIKFLEEDLVQEYESTFSTYLKNKLGEEIEGTRKIVKYRVPSVEVQMYQDTVLSGITPGIKYVDFTKKSTLNGLVSRLADFGCTTNLNNELVSSQAGDGYRPFDQVTFELIVPEVPEEPQP